jgi:hypothetical protein
MSRSVTVKQNDENPEPLEVIAASVIKVAEGIEKMAKSGLSKRAIVVLLNDVTGVPKGHIGLLIDAGPALRRYMLS